MNTERRCQNQFISSLKINMVLLYSSPNNQNDQAKEDEMGMVCRTHTVKKNAYIEFWWERPKRPLETHGVGGYY
jgi:hypothetical protein